MSKKLLRKKWALMLATLEKKRPYYTEVEYLESTGTQYIDTGIKVNTTTSLYETKIVPLNTQSQAIFGARNTSDWSDTDNAVSFIIRREGFRFDWAAGNEFVSAVPITVGSEYIIKITGNRYEINGTVQTFSDAVSTDIVYNFLIGTLNSSEGSFPDGFIGRVYYCKLYNNDVLVRDLIPVLDWDMTPCMYDKVSGQLFYNQGTGDFLYGST